MDIEMDATPTFWLRLGTAPTCLSRILLILVMLGLVTSITAAVYFGIPYLFTRYIQPVEENTTRLKTVESQQAANMQHLAGQFTGLQTGFDDLQAQQAQDSQAMADMQAQVNDLHGQLPALQTAIDGYTQTLKQLQGLQAGLDTLQETSAAQTT